MSAWDVTPGAVAPASVDLEITERHPIGYVLQYATITLTAEDLDELVAACEAQLDRSYDLLHPGHGDTDPAERAS